MIGCFVNVSLAENNYPYKSVCPGGDRYFDGYDAKTCINDDCFFRDRWKFAQCNCTSYAAHVLNAYGISFNNSYRQTGGKHWRNNYTFSKKIDTTIFAC